MNNTIFTFPKPENEPVLGYKPGSPLRPAGLVGPMKLKSFR